MTGLWLLQEELDRLGQLVGNLKYVEALPIIQLLNSAHQRSAARRVPTQHAADMQNVTVPVPASTEDPAKYAGGTFN